MVCSSDLQEQIHCSPIAMRWVFGGHVAESLFFGIIRSVHCQLGMIFGFLMANHASPEMTAKMMSV